MRRGAATERKREGLQTFKQVSTPARASRVRKILYLFIVDAKDSVHCCNCRDDGWTELPSGIRSRWGGRPCMRPMDTEKGAERG